MQHRIFLVPAKPGISWAQGQAHWRTNHEAIMVQLPHLLGYVQNRPTEEWWIHLPFLVCSETWYASRETEAKAYTSDWYKEQIAVDEARMFARDDAWSSPVVSVDTLREGMTGRYRTMAFGADPARLDELLFDGRAEVLNLHRKPPSGDHATVVCVWTDHAPLAATIAQQLGGLAFVAEPGVSMPPRQAPWGNA